MDIFTQLARDEGIRTKPYRDSVGKLTIGIGRNLDDVGISIEEANVLVQNDVAHVSRYLVATWPWMENLGDARFGALINMGFQLGLCGLAAFTKFLEFMKNGQFQEASDEMLKSVWATQVPARATRLSIQIRDGVWT